MSDTTGLGRVRCLLPEVLGFAVAGALAYGTDLLVFASLRISYGWNPVGAKIVSATAACLVAYLGNRLGPYRHRTHRGGARTAVLFCALQLVAALVQVACLLTSHYVLGFTSARADIWAGSVIGMVLATALRFWGTRSLVFRSGPPSTERPAPMPHPTTADRRRSRRARPARARRVPRNRALALVLTAALGAGAWMLYDGAQTVHPPQPSAADAFADPAAGGLPAVPGATAGTPAVKPLPASVPVRIKIPSIQVDAPVTLLNLDKTNQLQVPPDTNRNLAGWYQGGAAPGAAGNAIMDGHVDTKQGPAVFYNLGSLHKGNTVEIDRKDGTAALFSVDAIEVYEKSAFPSSRVYGATKDPQLRLITCGGGYHKNTGYLGNVVLYAHLTGSKQL
ncbi:class F sortase [Streptacidiphilus sp. PAMC 29251]